MIASSVIVGAGVVHEPSGMNGASHLLEHMLFNGTEHRTQRQLYDEVDRYGAYNNATTGEDHTLFSLLIAKEYIEQGLDIQADMLFHSTLPPENFEKEKKIVLEEMAQTASDPGWMAGVVFRRFAYAGTPLSRPVLGTEESITGIRRDSLWAYYKARYVPSNMLLVLMGDFDTERMMAVVDRTFGKAPAGHPTPAVTGSFPGAPAHNLALRPLNAPRTYVDAAFPLGLGPHDPLVPAVELLLEALAGGKDAPLTHALTSGTDPVALSISLGVARRAGQWTTVEFRAVVPEGKPYAAVVDALGRGLRSLGRGSLARSRLDLVRASARADEILDADRIHYFVMLHSDALLEAPAGYLSRVAQQFDNVTEGELDAAASVLAERLAELRVTVAGPKIQVGERHWVPPPVRTGSEPASRTVTDTLPNGTQVILVRNDDSQVFAVHVALRPRSAAEPPGKEGIVAVLHRMFTRGTLVDDQASLSARLDLLGARLKTYDDPSIPFDDYYTTPEFSYLRLELPADAWREGVMLLGELLRFPRLQTEELESAKKAILDIQTRRAESSSARALGAMSRLLAPGNPLSRPVLGTPESISSLTVDDLRTFYRQYVTGRHLIVTGVSPVDPSVVLEAVRAALKEIPPGNEPPQVPKVPLTPSAPPSQRSRNLREQTSIVMAYVFDAPAADRPALAVAGAMLSDALEFELREKRGLAYSIGASVEPWGGRTRFLVRMGTRQKNLDEALDGLRRGITSFQPSSEAAVSRAANALRGRLLMRRLTTVNQAYFLALERMDGEQPGDTLRYIEGLSAVHLDAVSRMVKAYFDVDRCAVVVE